MLNRTISVLFIIYIAISCIVLFIPALIIWIVTYPFDKKKKIQQWYTCFWGASYSWVFPSWKVKLTGRDKYRNNVTYIVVSNHQSLLDILLVFNLFKHFKLVSKSEMFRLPFVGLNMYFNRYVKLIRGDKDSIKKMMVACEERLKEGNSVFFFSEGTRSHDARVNSFKPGAFILAQKLKLPILPIAISGTSNALPKHSLNYHGIHNLYLDVMDEIPYEKFSSLSVEETAEMVKNLISNRVEELVEIDKRIKMSNEHL